MKILLAVIFTWLSSCDYHRLSQEALEAKVRSNESPAKLETTSHSLQNEIAHDSDSSSTKAELSMIELPSGSLDEANDKQGVEQKHSKTDSKPSSASTSVQVSPVAVPSVIEELNEEESFVDSVKGFISSSFSKITSGMKADHHTTNGIDTNEPEIERVSQVEPLVQVNQDSIEVCLKLVQAIPDEAYFYQLQSVLRKTKTNEQELNETLKGYAEFWRVRKKSGAPSNFAWSECYTPIMAFERFADVRHSVRRTARENTAWVSDQLVKIRARDSKPLQSDTQLAH